jgi:hypothetical protein
MARKMDRGKLLPLTLGSNRRNAGSSLYPLHVSGRGEGILTAFETC